MFFIEKVLYEIRLKINLETVPYSHACIETVYDVNARKRKRKGKKKERKGKEKFDGLPTTSLIYLASTLHKTQHTNHHFVKTLTNI